MNNVDNSKELPTVLSLCTGYGGIERGLELAGLEHRVVAHVEIEAFAAANLVSKMEDGKLVPAPVWTNLKTLPVEVFRDRVSILTGGYPCQPFSSAGKRLGEEDPRHLWPYILDIIKAIRPVRCFFENVEGHISLGLREVVSDLESLGYKVAWGIFSAREVGAAHQRKRVYIMADSGGSRQQAFGNQPRSEWEAGFVSQSGELADTSGEGLEGPHDYAESPERIQLVAAKCGSDDERSELADTSLHDGIDAKTYPQRADSHSVRSHHSEINKQGRVERGAELQHKQVGEFRQVRAELADSDSTRLRQSDQEDARQSSEQSDSGGFQSGNLADAISEGSQGWLHRRKDKERQSELRYAGRGSPARQQQGYGAWPPEPSVGRVVDGCADRVDRIRLLGNGVVPQTAAKAWVVLCAELQLKSDETTIA